ncbi:MAG: hypothetical protein HY268_06015 [Deltaproteobacteria bacterium]|nr:hypothetical protein [Deltaproteobacteria bacterium]
MNWFTPSSSSLQIPHDGETAAPHSSAQPDDEGRVLQQELRDAQALLAYALADGRVVDYHIIRDIRHASTQVHGSGPVAAEYWARFEHAYGRLTHLLSPLTADILRTLAVRERWSSLLGTGVCAILISIALMILTSLVSAPEQRLIALPVVFQIIVGLFGGLLFLLTLWARLLFTDVVTRKTMSDLILFCYIFTVFFLLSPGLLLFLSQIPRQLETALQRSPIGLLFGCVASSSSRADTEAGPKELFCAHSGGNGQWLIKIGGGLPGEPASATGEEARDHVTTSGSAAGHTTLMSPAPLAISGGVIVPLYVVVFAFWGGAVNMLRRVPEYQRRGLDVKDPLTREQARACLIFEMTQVLAAPLIALTAYSLLEPGSHKGSVALGFVSGLASHTVLQTLQAAMDTLTPARLGTARPESQPPTGEAPGKGSVAETPTEGLNRTLP